MKQDTLFIDFDYDKFVLKGFNHLKKCPQCGLTTAQQLLTSFLCANLKCGNYDAKLFADALRMHLIDNMEEPAGGVILRDKIKIVPMDDGKFDITIPFLYEEE